MSAPGTLERRSSKRLATRQGSAPYVGKDAKSGSTGITKYMENSSLDWDDKKAAAPAASSSVMGRTMTFRKKGAKEKLPRNWKKAKEKDGTVYYINSVTQRRCHELPPELPKGWREALHKESGRVYYYHKATRQSTFEFPTAAAHDHDDDDVDDDAEPPPAPEGFFGRTKSLFVRGKKDKDGELGRTSTMSQKSFKPGASGAKKGKAAAAAAEEKPSEGAGGQKTVFISCSTLIKEVKLCVGAEHQKALDQLYEKLTTHQLPAEQAVKQLMELVGSTVVQQAGLSVMNSQKGTLPHGWLEYIDEASGRPYYYNVHTKVTTWYKPAPTGAAPGPPPSKRPSGDEVNMTCSLETHNVAMTGFI